MAATCCTTITARGRPHYHGVARDQHGYGAQAMKYRFAWTYPILFSPHDPNVLYVTGNVVFRSTDLGRAGKPSVLI